MGIGEICTRNVVVAPRTATVKAAAELMRTYHVGCIVLVKEANGKRVPAGLLTDRDIVVSVTALGLDPEVIQAGDVATDEPLQIREDAGVADAVSLMSARGVRRLPVVDRAGALVGIIAADDIIPLLAEEMGGLATMATREQKRETAHKRTRAASHA